jgi:E1A/CREB-binding protein
MRLVSQDHLGSSARMFQASPRSVDGIPRRISEKAEDVSMAENASAGASQWNNSALVQTHITAVRLEADLFPMRLILARLIAHPQYNKKGLFNDPVDAQALGLLDYHKIIDQPMDLGTVKRRLHGMSYKSRSEVARDIRLVFTNAMKYNPPHNLVHVCARELLAQFAEYNTGLPPCVIECDPVSKVVESPPPITQPCKLAPLKRRRSSSMSLTFTGPHSCDACMGKVCPLCKQGCLKQEPTLLVCQGRHCGGAKIRKGSIYYLTPDGGRQYCERCFTTLPPVLSQPSTSDAPLYKQCLLKRKNNEEIVEDWVDCSTCGVSVHAICAMHNSSATTSNTFTCPTCQVPEKVPANQLDAATSEAPYTFISGSELPVPLSDVVRGKVELSCESLEECAISSFIQQKVRDRVQGIPNASKTVNIRIISDSDRDFKVPEVIRKHFRMVTEGDEVVQPPVKVSYRQKAIAMFQKIDGLDVCVFCMYVQEYDGNDDYGCELGNRVKASHAKRVYIAYIDSVEYFRPRECRTQVYQEILLAYLATARKRGYEKAQIWACPPSRGNSFVFWNHPASQRTPTLDRLVSWYHNALGHSVDCGVVTDVKSLYETDFEKTLEESSNRTACGRVICPPLFEGDYWIEEAVRLHDASISRNMKIRSPTEVCVWHVTPLKAEELDPCPSIQMATLVKDRIMTHPSSVPFRRPVNAAALKLVNYHEVVKEPMDLGTIYSRCVVGEYQVLSEVVADVRLMVSNALKFNPSGHFVCLKASEVLDLFFLELSSLVKIWSAIDNSDAESWESYSNMSMSLDFALEMPQVENSKYSSVLIEDDRSSDGSRSTVSVSSAQSSTPCATESVTAPSNDAATPDLDASTPAKIISSKRGRGRKPQTVKKCELLEDASEAIKQRMVGSDLWLVDKNLPTPPKRAGGKGSRKRRRTSIETAVEDPVPKKRQQSWLGEDVAESVRVRRTTLFTCSLVPKVSMTEKEAAKLRAFQEYARDFNTEQDLLPKKSSPITETRHAFLELSQLRRLEFNTLRRAKYSTAMLIYHIKNEDASGVVPVCTCCNKHIENVMWHKVKVSTEKPISPKAIRPPQHDSAKSKWIPGELCIECHRHRTPTEQEEYIPIPFSLKVSKSETRN